MSWMDVADVADLGDKGLAGVEVGPLRIALYRLDSDYFATSNQCPHLFASLSNGDIVGGSIRCPGHYAMFDIRTGKAQDGPVDADLRTFPVRVEGSRILVDVSDPSS